MFESKTVGLPHLTDDDINRAIVRAHALRSEYIAAWGRALGRWLRASFKASHRSTRSEAEHEYPAPSSAHADAGASPPPADKSSTAREAKENSYRWTA